MQKANSQVLADPQPAASSPADLWLAHGNRMAASNAMFAHLLGRPDAVTDGNPIAFPLCMSELASCRLLTESVPEIMHNLHGMKSVSGAWSQLVEKWSEVCSTMDEEGPKWRSGLGRFPETFDILTAIARSVPLLQLFPPISRKPLNNKLQIN